MAEPEQWIAYGIWIFLGFTPVLRADRPIKAVFGQDCVNMHFAKCIADGRIENKRGGSVAISYQDAFKKLREKGVTTYRFASCWIVPQTI